MPITLITGPAERGQGRGRDGRRAPAPGPRRGAAAGRARRARTPSTTCASWPGGGARWACAWSASTGLIGEAVRRAGIGEALLGAAGARARCSRRSPAARGLGGEGTCSRAAGFVRALGELFAELQVRRVSPAAAEPGAARSGRAADGRARPSRRSSGGCSRDYRARRSSGSGAWTPSSARCARWTRCARAPRCGARTPVLFYGFDDLTALQLDAIETLGRVVDAAGDGVAAYEPGRTAFAGRAATLPGAALRSRVEQRRAAGARRLLRAACARRAEPSRALAVRAAAPRAWTRAARCACSRAAASAPSSSSSRGEIARAAGGGHGARGDRGRARAPAADRGAAGRGASPRRGIPYALQRRRPFADTRRSAAR